VARQVRSSQNPGVAGLPLVAASYLVERDPELFVRAGFDQSLVKPIRREHLFQVLADMLGSYAKKTGSPAGGSRPADADDAFPGRRVLVAEDNAVNQKLIQMLLRKLGCRPTLAATGVELVEMFTRQPEDYDLIFMDIQMPEMDGFEAFFQIRKRGFTEIPVVAMTAHAMAEQKEECLSAGMDDYIARPIRKPELVRVLRRFFH